MPVTGSSFSKKSKNKPISRAGFTRWSKAKKAQGASSSYKGVGEKMSAGTSRTAKPMVEKFQGFKQKRIESHMNPRDMRTAEGSMTGSEKVSAKGLREGYEFERDDSGKRVKTYTKELAKPKKQFMVARGRMPKAKYKSITR